MNSISSESEQQKSVKFYAEHIPVWTDEEQARDWVHSDEFDNAPPLDKARNLVALYALRHAQMYRSQPTELYKPRDARKATDAALSVLCDEFGNNIVAAVECVLFVMRKARASKAAAKESAKPHERWIWSWVFTAKQASDFRAYLAEKGRSLPLSSEAFSFAEDSSRDRIDPRPAARPGPMIVVRDGSESELVDQAVEIVAESPTMFVNAGRIVNIGEDEILPLDLSMFRARISGAARWVRLVESGDKVSEVDIDCPFSVAKAVHGAKKWPGAKNLVGVVDHPIMRPDGSILDVPGYDAATGYVYRPSPSLSVPEIPSTPTKEQAEEALARMIAPFCDFRYQKPNQVYVAIAAMMSIVGRAALGNRSVPGFFFDAPEKDSGKTHHLKAISLVATGQTMRQSLLGQDKKEQTKLFGGWVKSGTRLVCVDNVPNGSTFGNDVIDGFFTSESASIRPLGTTDQIEADWRGVMLFSGNNIKIRTDTSRRLIMVRLLQLPPEKKDFKFDLLRHVLENRGQYIADIFTVLRYHVTIGRPKHNGRGEFSSFEAWQSVIADAIVSAGGADIVSFCVDKDESKKEDDKDVAAAFAFVRAWGELSAPEREGGRFDRGLTAQTLAHRIWPQYDVAGTEREDLGYSSEGLERSEIVAELADMLLEPTNLFDPKHGWTKGPSKLGSWLKDQSEKTLLGKYIFDEDHPGYGKTWRIILTKNRNKTNVYNVIADGDDPRKPTPPLVLQPSEPKPKRGRSAPAVH